MASSRVRSDLVGPFGPFFDPFWPFGWGAMAPRGSGTPIVMVKWGGSQNWWAPRAQVASIPYFGAIFGHFEPFFGPFGPFFDPFWPFWVGGNGSKWVQNPYSWGKMGWGVKIGGSRGPTWRPDPILGPFLAILSHFWPFWAFF